MAENGSTVTPATVPTDAGQPAAGPVVRRRLPAPGVLELEDLLSNHLNTRVKVEMGAKRGRVVIDFATLEDLERVYKLMVGGVTA
jgi:ParB family chromosome partitioning protein